MTAAARRLAPVQARRRAVLGAAAALLVLLILTRTTLFGKAGHFAIEHAGWAMMSIAIVGRAWCSLYIGGRKVRDLVSLGPYSISRNPLYLFSIVGATGMAAQGGSLVIAIAGGAIAWLVLRAVIGHEERALAEVHGEAYRTYVDVTPRLFPDVRRWRDADVLEVRPALVVRTVLDGMVLFLSIPVAEGLEKLSEAGLIPVLLHLP